MEADTSPSPDSRAAEQTQSMGRLLAGEQLESMLPRRGELREGTIARVSPNEILVDIGAKSEGIIAEHELNRMSAEAREQLQVGAPVTLYVVRGASQEGPIVLSMQKAEEMQQWQQVEEQREARSLLTGPILEFNRGGVVVAMGQLRGFLPASLMSLERRQRNTGATPAERWQDMVGEELTFKIKEVDAQRDRLILSERAAEKEARSAQRVEFLARIEPGQIHSGRVVSLTKFGAFVDIGGIDGLVHVSQISWTHIDHPREALKVGQEIDVQVLSVDLERQRVALSLKALQQDPWATLNDSHKEGQLVRATITRLTKFGAFAALKDRKHIEGLVHISELADSGVTHPKEVVQENDEVTLRIMKIDAERHRLGLSLKEVVSPRFAELDYAFYVAAEEKTEPDTEAAAEEPAAAPAPPEGSEDSAAVIAENTAEAGQPLAETIESVEAAEAAEGLDAQQPTQIAADETE